MSSQPESPRVTSETTDDATKGADVAAPADDVAPKGRWRRAVAWSDRQLKRVRHVIELGRQVLTDVAVIGGVGFLAWLIASALWHRSDLHIASISVPERLKSDGFTAEVVT